MDDDVRVTIMSLVIVVVVAGTFTLLLFVHMGIVRLLVDIVVFWFFLVFGQGRPELSFGSMSSFSRTATGQLRRIGKTEQWDK